MNNKIISKTISGALLCTMVAYTMPVLAYTKDETVYSKQQANGTNYNTIVSTHIENSENAELIKDMTDLLNIQNTNGEETFTQEGNNITWQAAGNDIYYKGETTKDLPIECNIKYELDGNEIQASEIAGKSGKVKITIKYTNKEEHTVKINGKNEIIYTPFIVIAGTIIDNEKNTNITVTNGKIINDGTKTMVIGIALPGLQESLNISKNDIKIPNSIEITMDATEFEQNNIITFATPKITDNDESEIFDELDKLYNKVDTLKTSSNQIEEGASTLQQGSTTYTEKMTEFNSAMSQVSQGMTQANKNYQTLDNGLTTLNTSSKQLTQGAKQISEGTQQVQTNLETISQKLGELQAGGKKLQAGEKELSAGIDQIIAKLSQINTTDNTAKITELETLVKTNNATIKTMQDTNASLTNKKNKVTDETTKATLQAQIDANEQLIKLLQTNTLAQEETIKTLKATDTTQIESLKKALTSLKNGISNLEQGTDTLQTGITAIKTGSDTLAQKTKELTTGTQTLYNGTVELEKGTTTLKTGSSQMKNGLTTLDSSSSKLLEANKALTQGAKDIQSGATTLSEGISKFNKEGIQVICNYVNNDLKNISTRAEKIIELSNQYNNFAMSNGENEGNVKFITITDAIKKQEQTQNKQEIILNDKENANN